MATPVSDTELGEYQPKHYHVLAQIMSRDTNLAIFRRFDDLNYLRVMRLQAELIEAKVVFEDRCKEDHTKNSAFAKSFRSLNASKKPPINPQYSDNRQESDPRCRCQRNDDEESPGQGNLWQCSQLEILEHIDGKLSQYNQLLIELSQVRSIRKPEKSQLKTLKNWLAREDGGNKFLEGSEALTWDESDVDEYACLATGTETDIFTKLIRRIIVTLFPWFFNSKKRKTTIEQLSGMRSYDDARVNSASNVISLVISSILPVLAIFVLNSRESTTDRLWFTVLFTAVFAAALGFFSSAKRAEVFAATATFAAIEVVFIGTALGAENNVPSATPTAT